MSDDSFIHTLARMDISSANVTFEGGRGIQMLRLHLWVHHHGDGADKLEHQLSPILLDSAVATALIQGLGDKLRSSFSERLALDEDASRNPQ